MRSRRGIIFSLFLLTAGFCRGAPGNTCTVGTAVSPADAAAAASVVVVLNYLKELTNRRRKNLLSGQFLGWHPGVTMAAVDEIHRQSGQWVALIGVDYYETTLSEATLTEPEFWKPPRWQAINPLIKQYWAKGGLATISVHMTNPFTGGKAWDTRQRASAALLDPQTEAGRAYLDHLNGIADGLEDLLKEGIVVLFRPFHEWDDHDAFWWCKLEAKLSRQLWQHMFRHFTEIRHLHNLIWVYNGRMERYPGNDWVDLNSLDCYGNYQATLTRVSQEMRGSGKPFAVAEFGPPGHGLDPDSPRNYDYSSFARMTIQAAPGTVFFLAWRDAWGLHRNPGTKELMNDPIVVNRDDLMRELFPKLHPSVAPEIIG